MTDTGDQTPETIAKAEYEKVLEKARNLEAKVVDFEKRYKGIDPEAARAHKQELELLRNEVVSKSGDPKSIEERIKAAKDELKNEYAKERETLEGALKSKDQKLKELQVDSVVFGTAAGQFVSGFHDDLKRYIREQCDLDSDGNIVIKDARGEVRLSASNKTKPMSVEEFIDELKANKPFAVIDKSLNGGKTPGEKIAGDGADISFEKFQRLSNVEQQQVLAKNPSLAIKFAQAITIR